MLFNVRFARYNGDRLYCAYNNTGDKLVRNRIGLALVFGSAVLLANHGASAHAVAGVRIFPVTLTMDDPGVADEASIPTFSWERDDSSGVPVNGYSFNFEYDKRITENFGIGINWGWNINQVTGGKTAGGFQNLFVTGKYQAYVNPEHEFIMSLGVVREFGGTGNINQGADRFGSTQPTIYVGKGLGDLPIGALRPLALTGELAYNIQDVRINSTGDNQGGQNSVNAAMSVQYSMPYLQSQVKDMGLPDFFNHLIPLVELTWNVPTGHYEMPQPTTFTVAPGVIYMGDSWQIGVEALIPGNTAAGTHVGVIAMFHVFLDDIFPNSLGKPLVDW